MRLPLAALLCAAISINTSLLNAQALSGRRAPSFSLPDSKFTQHDILDYRGRWLIVDFMKTNCPHCNALTATLEEVKARYGTKLGVLEIVVPPDNLNTVAKYITETKTTSPVVFDSGQVAAAYFNITPINQKPFDTPHWFLVDPSGMIVRDWTQGLAGAKDWVKELDQLVAKK
jgi:peroxiredoxin